MYLPFAFSKGYLIKKGNGKLFFRVSIEFIETRGEPVRNSTRKILESSPRVSITL